MFWKKNKEDENKKVEEARAIAEEIQQQMSQPEKPPEPEEPEDTKQEEDKESIADIISTIPQFEEETLRNISYRIKALDEQIKRLTEILKQMYDQRDKFVLMLRPYTQQPAQPQKEPESKPEPKQEEQEHAPEEDNNSDEQPEPQEVDDNPEYDEWKPRRGPPLKAYCDVKNKWAHLLRAKKKGQRVAGRCSECHQIHEVKVKKRARR